MIISGLVGYNTYQSDGLNWRSAANTIQKYSGDIGHESFHQYLLKNYFPCKPISIRDDAPRWEGVTRCFQSKENVPIQIALIGDSHVEHLFIGVANSTPDVNVAYFIKNTLPSINDPSLKNIFNYVLGDENIRTIIISAFWMHRHDLMQNPNQLTIELQKTIAKLVAAGKKVVIADDIPSFTFDTKKCKYSRILSGNNNCLMKKFIFDRQLDSYLPYIKNAIPKDRQVILVHIGNSLCDESNCSMVKDGAIFYRDENHLNLLGSQYVGSYLVRKMNEGENQSFRSE